MTPPPEPAPAPANLPTKPGAPVAERVSRVPVVLAVVVTVLAWASAFVMIRLVGDRLSPGALTLGRLAVGSAALTVTVRIGLRARRLDLRPLRVLPARGRWLLVLIGVAWFGVYNVALNAGERHIDAGTAAMIIQTGPVLIAVLAGTVLREGFPTPLVVGLVVALAGTGLIGVATSRTPAGQRPAGGSQGLGVVLVLLSAIVYSVAMVAQKVVLVRVPGLLITWVACLVGTAVCLPFAGQLVTGLAAAPASVWWSVVYLGLVPTALAFSTWAYALGRTNAGRLGVTTYAVPPIAIGLGWLLLGEVPLPLALVGGLVCLVGVGLSRYRPRAQRAKV